VSKASFKPAANYFIDRDGYEVNRYICENAPTNRVRPAYLLDGHGYERFSVGNGAGYRWLAHMRAKTCPKCGGRMIPINEWVPKA
jgi:hypothetical protein